MSLLVKVSLQSNKLAAIKDGFLYKSSFTAANKYKVSFDAIIVGYPHLRNGNQDPNEVFQVRRVSDDALIYCPYGAFSEFRTQDTTPEEGTVNSVTGTLVDNTDPSNPIINTPVVTYSDITEKPTSFPPSPHTHIATDISNSSTVGRNVLTAIDQAAARTALGLGTAATTASSAYATAAQGTLASNAVPQSQLNTSAANNTVPLRKTNGRIETGTATDGADAVNLTQLCA